MGPAPVSRDSRLKPAAAGRALACALVCVLGGPALAQPHGAPPPLSAIDWLQRGASEPQPGAYPVTPPAAGQTAAQAAGISVRALDALRPEAVGLYPAARVGLPVALWGPTPAGRLAELITALPTDMLPALRDLSLRLLLAEFTAPLPDANPGSSPDFLLARIDKLIEFGALDQAAALLDTLGSQAPVLRLRRFDIGLLLGDEHAACAGVLAPEPPLGEAAAQIFCLAREGRWDEADALLATAQTDGSVTPYMADLLGNFINDEERLPGADTLIPPPPGAPDPLAWRLREATGGAETTLGLPVAFAHSDLRGTVGWRAQIEAAERLVQAGALSPNRLLGLYTERRAAASGGIWERVREIQRLDAALRTDDAEAAGTALLAAWPLIQAGELEVAMAGLFAPPLQGLSLSGEARALAFRVGLLSPDYETVALALEPATATPEERFLAALARGLDPRAGGGAFPGELAEAVAIAFGPAPELPEGMAERLAEGRLGEEILTQLIGLGGPGDPRVLAEGLAALRALGLEDIARRTALESLLLERRG